MTRIRFIYAKITQENVGLDSSFPLDELLLKWSASPPSPNNLNERVK